MPASFSTPIPTLLLWGYFLNPGGSYNLVKESEACGDVGPSCSIPIFPPLLQISFCLSFSLCLSLTQACTWDVHQKIGTHPLLHDSLNWPLIYFNILCNFTTFPSLPPSPCSVHIKEIQFSSVQLLTRV